MDIDHSNTTTSSIALIDNTAPRRRHSETPTATTNGGSHISRKWTKRSIRGELKKRKYAKWQPDRLGLTTDDEDNTNYNNNNSNNEEEEGIPSSSRRPFERPEPSDLFTTETATTTSPPPSQYQSRSDSPSQQQQQPSPPSQDVSATDFAPESNTLITTTTTTTGANAPKLTGLKPNTELDILYENQRGWFFFGIPLYSHSSLLNFDPSAWQTADLRDSPVDITNAQVPDPSWVWAWRSWYVDMSGDVDDQGWQYSFSFKSTAWHGSHPWFHSFVRRRRWVRVRTKRLVDRHGRTELEMAHRLNEDYFTIHSGKNKKKRPVSEVGGGGEMEEEEGAPIEEIADIPALMHALRVAIVDREKVDALDRFVDEGGEELFYLDEKIPEIMSMFVFQASRWHFVLHLTDVVESLSQQLSSSSGDNEAAELQRKLNHLRKATETARRHLTGPGVLRTENRKSSMEMLDLTPVSKRGSLLARYSGRFEFKSMDDGGEIKGIPKEAELPCLFFPRPFRSLYDHDPDHGHASQVPTPRLVDTVAASPEEPLLFLYPRWVGSAVRQHRSLVSSSGPSPCGNGNVYNAAARRRTVAKPPPAGRKLSFGSSSRRWVSTTAAEAAVKTEVKQDVVPPEQGKSAAAPQKGKRGEENADTGPPASIYNQLDNDPETEVKSERHVFNIFSDLQTRPVQPTTGRKGMRSSAGETPAIALKRLSHRDRRKLRYRLFLTKQSQGRDKGKNNQWNKWTKIREMLEEMHEDTHVWAKKGVKQKELLVPEETIALLTGVTDMALKENVWYVPVHNGCKVHVLRPLQSQGRFRRVILSGSERVVELVSDRIAQARRLQEQSDPLVDIQIPLFPIIPSIEALKRQGAPVPLVRGVWDIQSAVKQAAKLHMVLPAGKNLSGIRDFAEHVEELTRSKPSYNSKIPYSHQKQVARALVQLFRNEAYSSFMSTAALNRALSYLLDHEFLNAARDIFLKSEHLATVDTFNILLKSAAKRQDLRFFRQFLLAMSRLSIRPDPNTWLTLLDCLVAPKAKADLVTYMLQRGYLENMGAMRTALHLTLPNTFRAHLESGKSVDSFIRQTADSCGDSCFAPSLISQMFGVIVRLKDFAALDRLFDICKQNDLTFNSATITQILSLFRADMPTALRYLFRCLERPETKLERHAWERLFLVAFKGQYYNICRVLWRYACMSGNVTYKMKRTVVTSLIRNVPRKPETNVHTIWDVSAGKVIVGLDLHRPDHKLQTTVLDKLPREYRTNPIAYLSSGYKPSGEEREQQIQVASALTQHDIEIGSWHRPQFPLLIMLEAASVLDQEWRKVPRPVHWLVQNAIRVPVRKSMYPA
ncbi:peroxin Pex23-like-Penicillium chrysogenum [Aspergillus luchuensis IFO 4308]|nr:peroxin Pex23-like-Penicillium chrysogenum [Aspergillus luchuensis IFO 4308]